MQTRTRPVVSWGSVVQVWFASKRRFITWSTLRKVFYRTKFQGFSEEAEGRHIAVKAFTLSVPQFIDAQHWTWHLSNANGELLCEHQVQLNPAIPEYEAFVDLDAYLRLHAAPDNRERDERRIIEQIGAWMGIEVLGPIGEHIVDLGLPVAVRVMVPPSATWLMYRPLELAYARGKPLARHDVTFVYQFAPGVAPVDVETGGSALRVLAVFSVPTNTSPLSVRHERVLLQKLFDKLAWQRAIELRVLQYGVTIESLRKVLSEGAGWDLIHISGHGRAGILLVEGNDGSSIPLPAQGLVELLMRARSRLKWVTLSSCLSASEGLSEARSWIGLEGIREDPAVEEAERAASSPERRLPGVASTIIQEMDCTVLAMRYAVEDRFAIEYAHRVYEYAIGQGNVLPRAMQLALSDAANTSGTRPIAIATPTLFGRRGTELYLQPPGNARPKPLRPPKLPKPTTFFVGRSSVMARANAVLSEKSDLTGVIFVGMAGIGKTTCAVELVDLQWALDRFSGFVWHKAPNQGWDIDDALNQFATDWENQLVDTDRRPRFPLVGLVSADSRRFELGLDQLTSFLESESLLIVIDNLESLLAPDGTWRNERFEQLVHTLFSHEGASRTIITSRVRPVFPEIAQTRKRVRVSTHSVNALTLDEAILLARQMPNLEKLSRSEHDRQLVKQVLEVVQGHPKLLEMADKQAADPQALRKNLQQARMALEAGGSKLDTFFVNGETVLEEGQFIATLTGWARNIRASIAGTAQHLFSLLCCLEEMDRCAEIVTRVWPIVCERLQINASDADVGWITQSLEDVGLIELRMQPNQDSPEVTDATAGDLYYIHPGIAETGAGDVPEDARLVIEETMADYWQQRYQEALDSDAAGGSSDVVEAGLRTAPYLLRLKLWDKAADLLEEVRYRDESPEANARLIPSLQKIYVATQDTPRYPRNLRIFGSVLLNAGEFEAAEQYLSDAADQCEAMENFKEASVALDVMISLLRQIGRSKDAFAYLKRMKRCTKNAGLGPWSQLVDEIWGLCLLHDIGEDTQVLAKVWELEHRMKGLPQTLGSEQDPVEPWAAKEFLLDVARQAALALEDWSRALELNARAIQSQKERGAPPLDMGQVKCNDYLPQIKLGEYDKARQLIVQCRAEFEQQRSDRDIGESFAALAALERALGHLMLAVDHEMTALRYRYKDKKPDACSRSHFHLAAYLALAQRDAELVGAHRAAGALIRYRTWAGELTTLAQILRSVPEAAATAAAPLPRSFNQVCELVETVQGVLFRNLFLNLPAYREENVEQAFAKVIEMLALPTA